MVIYMEEKDINILIVDDEPVIRDSLATWFEDDGYTVGKAESAKEALVMMNRQRWDIGVFDIKMPGMDGLELQRKIKDIDPEMTVIIMTAYASVQTAVEALKEGAYDYILKPFDPDQLSVLMRNAVERRELINANLHLRKQITEEAEPDDFVGQSPEMIDISKLISKVAKTDSTVLILGESGTGKELIARSIHDQSKRRFMPMVTVNCGALPEGVLESELFGHEKGAFTGALYRRKGRFEMADGGTIFLDEIGDIGPKTQSDLLRVLEEKKITRVGGTKAIDVDFRIISATNKDLEESVKKGELREDLFYRLNIFTINVPPLRERTADILPLANHFLDKFNRRMGLHIQGFTKAAEKAMLSYSWPGNIRELENAIERSIVVCEKSRIDTDDFPFNSSEKPQLTEKVSLAEVEYNHIKNILINHNWNISESARVLGIDRVTLYNKIKKMGLKRPDQE